MPNVNKLTVMDVLGRVPETKNLSKGGSITTFSVATWSFGKTRPLESVKNLQNSTESVPRTFRKYLKKSSKSYIEGSLRTGKWKG